MDRRGSPAPRPPGHSGHAHCAPPHASGRMRRRGTAASEGWSCPGPRWRRGYGNSQGLPTGLGREEHKVQAPIPAHQQPCSIVLVSNGTITPTEWGVPLLLSPQEDTECLTQLSAAIWPHNEYSAQTHRRESLSEAQTLLPRGSQGSTVRSHKMGTTRLMARAVLPALGSPSHQLSLRVNSPEQRSHSQCRKGGQPALQPGLEKTCLGGQPPAGLGLEGAWGRGKFSVYHTEGCPPVCNGQLPFRKLCTRQRAFLQPRGSGICGWGTSLFRHLVTSRGFEKG